MLQKISTIEEILQFIKSSEDKAVFLKDANSQYISCNEFYAKKLNLNCTEEIAGLSDLVLNPKYDEIYRDDDQYVMKTAHSKPLYNPASYPQDGDVFVEGVLKPVILDKKKQLIGVLGIMEVREHVLAGSFFSVLEYLRNHSLIKHLKQDKFQIGEDQNAVLSKNELACYFYSTFLNLTSKEIAKLIHLSPRSIEKYIERVRQKGSLVPLSLFNHAIQEHILQSLR